MNQGSLQSLLSWKEAFEVYQRELRDLKISKTPDSKSMLVLTHEKYAKQGRKNVLQLMQGQEADRENESV